MFITQLELPTRDLQAQGDFYANALELSVALSSSGLEVKAGETDILFTQAAPSFEGAYHFAFNIPENQFHSARDWIASRAPLLHDKHGSDEFASGNWNSHSLYFRDTAGNILEFIARHDLKNGVDGGFDGSDILNVSEIGLPSRNVIGLTEELCSRLGLSAFKQTPDANFTAVGDDHGLFILPIVDRIWMPDSGAPATLLPIMVKGQANGREWEVRGVPYTINIS